jgi:hypothetical protein
MTTKQKKWLIGIGAVLIVVAFAIAVAEIFRNPILLASLFAIGLIVLVILRIRAARKTRVIFGFYVAANEILIDGEGNRYHFEIADVIRTGEKIVRTMRDAPPLSRFALGALYYSINDHNGAVEQLGFAAEEEVLKESEYLAPSRRLRRYVKKLRRIERRPKRYAKINAAISSLERMRYQRGARLLAESQKQLLRMVEAYDSEIVEQSRSLPISSGRSLKSINAPPTISEVLNEVYQEESNA